MMAEAPAGSNEEDEQLRAGMKRFALRTNLGLVLRHYDGMERLISEAVDPTDRASMADEPVAHAYNAANAVLRACGYLTEAAYIISGAAIPSGNPSFLEKLKPILSSRGLHLGGQEWETLTDAFAVRHCLLHGNGRLSLMGETQADELRVVIEKHPEGLHLRHDRIWVHRRFVEEVVNAVSWAISSVPLA